MFPAVCTGSSLVTGIDLLLLYTVALIDLPLFLEKVS